jgi:HK97 family phage major capsid protein
MATDYGQNIQARDVTTSDPGAAGFVPPIYMGELWAELPRADRPFADVIRKMPLPATGMTVSIPKVQSGTTVASQATENTAVSETDADSQTVNVPVRTIAGMNDMSLQAFERTAPGFDMIVAEDLRAAYDAELDRQCSQGTGAAGQHLGIRAVAGVNTVAYTDATPTAAELHPKLYDAIQKIASVRFKQATHLLMHPRRAAWIASNLSSTFPLIQQGGLIQAVGTQDGGFTRFIAGLPIIDDPNVGTLLGAGTEDEIYAIYNPDLILMEDAPRFEVFRDVLSGTGEARLRLWAYSAFASARQPTGITIIAGTGLIAPTF